MHEAWRIATSPSFSVILSPRSVLIKQNVWEVSSHTIVAEKLSTTKGKLELWIRFLWAREITQRQSHASIVSSHCDTNKQTIKYNVIMLSKMHITVHYFRSLSSPQRHVVWITQLYHQVVPSLLVALLMTIKLLLRHKILALCETQTESVQIAYKRIVSNHDSRSSRERVRT